MLEDTTFTYRSIGNLLHYFGHIDVGNQYNLNNFRINSHFWWGFCTKRTQKYIYVHKTIKMSKCSKQRSSSYSKYSLSILFFVLFSTETFSHVYHNLTGKFFYDHEISHLLWNCRSRVSIPNRVYRQLKPNWIHVCAATNLRSVSCI